MEANSGKAGVSNASNDELIERLLERYRIVFEYLKNHDITRQQRNRNFLLANPILVVALSVFAGSGQAQTYLAFGMILSASFGLAICFIWHFVMRRNGQYLRLTHMELRSIEASLCELGFEIRTFTDVDKALKRHKRVDFENIRDFFILKRASWSGARLEGCLSIIIGIFWLILLAVGIGSML